MSYWDLLTYKYVLNIGVADPGIMIGYSIKNSYMTLAGATFELLIYCLDFMFASKNFFTTFCLATYAVFFGFASPANLAQHFKIWVLGDRVGV